MNQEHNKNTNKNNIGTIFKKVLIRMDQELLKPNKNKNHNELGTQ